MVSFFFIIMVAKSYMQFTLSLVMEIAPQKYQILVGFICFETAAVGHAILPGFAYAFKNWRILQITCGLLPVLYLPFHCLMKESPR